MAKLEGIQIQNYRSLKNVILGRTFDFRDNEALSQIISIIGPNGAGKTSIIDAFGFIGDCLRFGVEEACDQSHRGGFSRLRTQNSDEPIKFEIYFRGATNTRPISYTLHIDMDENGVPFVAYERLRQRRKGQSKGWPFSFLEISNGKGFVWAGESTTKEEGNKKEEVELEDKKLLGLVTFGNLTEHPRIVAFREFLEGWYLSYFLPDLARGLPIAGVQKHLNKSGDNLANYLQYIERHNSIKFSHLLKKVSNKIPGIKNIKHAKSEDGRLLIEFYEEGYEKPFYAQDMSDGSLKLFAYLLLMADPDSAPLIGIEEPENGLYHQLMEPLALEMKEFSNTQSGPQMLISTHSPYFIDALAPGAVWILKKINGLTHVFRLSDIDNIS